MAVALAMDAFAVSVAAGVYLKNISPRQFFRLSFHFGLFQAMMPVIGWSAGFSVRALIEKVDHWIAFFLLLAVGISMIREAVSEKEEARPAKDPTKGKSLIILSVATSVDALAVGFSLSILNASILAPSIVIGLTALSFTVLGLYIGSKAVNISWLKRYAEILGALVLFAIGLSIMADHGVFQALLNPIGIG
jgi:putative Mn2+ efflux pump MntP